MSVLRGLISFIDCVNSIGIKYRYSKRKLNIKNIKEVGRLEAYSWYLDSVTYIMQKQDLCIVSLACLSVWWSVDPSVHNSHQRLVFTKFRVNNVFLYSKKVENGCEQSVANIWIFEYICEYSSRIIFIFVFAVKKNLWIIFIFVIVLD